MKKITLNSLISIIFIIIALFSLYANFCYAGARRPERLVRIGDKFIAVRDFVGALAFYKKAMPDINTDELRIRAYYGISSCYLGKGTEAYIVEKDKTCYIKAIEYARKVIALDPDHWRAMQNIALAYMEMGDFDQAEKFFKKSISKAEETVNKNDSDYVTLLVLYENLSRKNK